MSDQDRISPYNINTESSRQVKEWRKNTQLGNYKLIQYQILQIEIKYFMPDSRENYQWDLGSQRVKTYKNIVLEVMTRPDFSLACKKMLLTLMSV